MNAQLLSPRAWVGLLLAGGALLAPSLTLAASLQIQLIPGLPGTNRTVLLMQNTSSNRDYQVLRKTELSEPSWMPERQVPGGQPQTSTLLWLSNGSSSFFAVREQPSVTNGGLVLQLPGSTISYELGGPPVFLTPDAMVSSDATNFNGGTLRVGLVAGGDPEDILVVQPVGPGPAQLGVTGSILTWGSVAFASFHAGSSVEPLEVFFNANATAELVAGVLRRLAFGNRSLRSSRQARTLRYELTDGHGARAIPTDQRVLVECAVGIDAIVLLDVSRSLSDAAFLAMKRTATNFIGYLDPAVDRVGLVTIYGGSTLVDPPTNNFTKVQLDLLALPQQSGTILHPALSNAQQAFVASSRDHALRVMLVLSDGQVSPRSTESEAIAAANAAKAAGTHILAAGFINLNGLVFDDFLRELASAPSDYYAPDHSSNAPPVEVQLAGQLRAAARSLCRLPNRPPSAQPQLVLVPQNTATGITLQGSDPDDDAIAFRWIDGPAHGALSGGTPGLVYTPNAGYVGPDSFRFVVSDGLLESGPALVTIQVTRGTNRAPYFVSVPITQVEIGTNGDGGRQPLDLSQWSVVQYPLAEQGPAEWVLSASNTIVTQTRNADASIFLSDRLLEHEEIRGTWQVSGDGDDDFIGFVFGYQDPQHYYLFDWKRAHQADPCGTALVGMGVRVIDASSPLGCTDLWPSFAETNRARTLYRNSIPWENGVDYGFTLRFTAGLFTILVEEGTNTLATITLSDASYPAGKFGFYNYSQGTVRYTGFTRQTLPSALYEYDSGAVDPDGDPVTYSFHGPSGIYAAAVQAEGPAGYWRLLEELGVTASDFSGQAHDGAYSGTVTLAAGSELAGTGRATAAFAGGVAEVPDTDSLRPARLSVEAWVNASSLPNWATVLMKSSNGAWADGYGLAHFAGANDINFFVNSYTVGQVSATLTPGRWTHLVGTYDGAELRIYTNGTLASARPYTEPILHSRAPLRMGNGTPFYPWFGAIGEVAIYDHALSSETVRAHSEIYRHPATPVPPGMIIDPHTGLIRWQPTLDQLGDHEVTLEAADGRGGLGTQSFRLQVQATGTGR